MPSSQCVPVVSSWVDTLVLTNSDFAIVFRSGACCLYPAAGQAMFNLALVAPSKGKFVHQFLYKKWPYNLIVNPCPGIVNPANTICVCIQGHKELDAFASYECHEFTGPAGAAWTVTLVPAAAFPVPLFWVDLYRNGVFQIRSSSRWRDASFYAEYASACGAGGQPP